MGWHIVKIALELKVPEPQINQSFEAHQGSFINLERDKMSNVTKLSDAIKFALFVGAASSAASVTAVAQEKDEAKTLDRVEVTGSRIKRVDAETSQPVAVITRADIEKSGVTNVFDILNNITASDGSGLSTVTTQTNGSDGSQRISLRGLGSQRTLVLVDGKRWLQDVNGSVDLSTIPLA
ncbi:MAG: TonB-dependent receptor plug domain-containing protein, partial [Arenimonas sp.]